MAVITLLADGARPDTLAAAIDGGELPALARLRDEGGLYDVSTCFPSVTGPAYAPFLMGRFPGPIGLPGLRWFDRARTTCSFPDYTRSYVGYQMRALDRDLDADAPTIFECGASSMGALSVIQRGLPARGRVAGLSLKSAFRTARTHFRGDVKGWLDIDREVARRVIDHLRQDAPEFVFAALTGIDKTSHAQGHNGPLVHEAMRIVDQTVAELRDVLEREGVWEETHFWIASDHGHSPVHTHDDLADVVRALGYKVIAHPWVYAFRPDVAVMVSGNAMSHLYLELARRERPFWPELRARWGDFVDTLLDRPSVDLAMLPHSKSITEVRSRTRGSAIVAKRTRHGTVSYTYRMRDGDPLCIGQDLVHVSADEAHEATFATLYPDSIVQITHLLGAPRSGEIVLSATPGWDFRAKHEPIPHKSAHGALHRDHMMTPLLLNRPAARQPLRTTDVMPSALAALGLQIPDGLDGESFVTPPRSTSDRLSPRRVASFVERAG